MLNTSPELDWQTYGAPSITDYMGRMREAGYGEGMRRDVLQHSARIYGRMRMEDDDGTRPMYRPKSFERMKRRKSKTEKKHSWSSRGGYIAPIFVPSTPSGELASLLRTVVEEEERSSGLKFRIVEQGGVTIKKRVQKSKPTATPWCAEVDCIACKGERGGGGNCRQSNIEYSMDCCLCPDSRPTAYHGETSRNLYTRAGEHYRDYHKGEEDSWIGKHQLEMHGGAQAEFTAKVTNSFRDCLTRQVSEAVTIRRSEKEVLNGKSEWHQPALFTVRNEIVRG